MINNYVRRWGQEFLVLTAAAVVDSFEVIEVFGTQGATGEQQWSLPYHRRGIQYLALCRAGWRVLVRCEQLESAGATGRKHSDILVGQEIRIGLPGALADEIRVLSPGTPAKSTSAPDVWGAVGYRHRTTAVERRVAHGSRPAGPTGSGTES